MCSLYILLSLWVHVRVVNYPKGDINLTLNDVISLFTTGVTNLSFYKHLETFVRSFQTILTSFKSSYCLNLGLLSDWTLPACSYLPSGMSFIHVGTPNRTARF